MQEHGSANGSFCSMLMDTSYALLLHNDALASSEQLCGVHGGHALLAPVVYDLLSIHTWDKLQDATDLYKLVRAPNVPDDHSMLKAYVACTVDSRCRTCYHTRQPVMVLRILLSIAVMGKCLW